MSKKDTNKDASSLAEQGTPISGNGQRLANGKPNLAPTAGYDGHYPVQFGDETDEVFAQRVAMFEDSFATAVSIEAGGANLEQQISALEAKFEAEKLALEEADKQKKAGSTVNGKSVK